MRQIVDDFQIGQKAMRYSRFAPRLYNYCLSLGFRRELMMLSTAFCSDETQGYPIILLTQHFGAFPFDHGRVGGKVATDRHGPHAHHGEDLVILQASHVGYDPVQHRFGVYRRPRIAGHGPGDTCGKLCAILRWYQEEYDHAKRNIAFATLEDKPAVFIDNLLLDPDVAEGLVPHLDRLIAANAPQPLKVASTSKAFLAAPEWVERLPADIWKSGRTPIGDWLAADMFSFRRNPVEGPEGPDLLAASLAPAMPALVTAAHPALDAARRLTQVEFDRTYRSLLRSEAYRGKNLLFVSGLNIDVSPPEGFPFPLTKFVPWAAYFQPREGASILLEQDALVETLIRQPISNPEQISFDAAIGQMADAEAVPLPW